MKEHINIQETNLIQMLANGDKKGMEILYHNYSVILFDHINAIVHDQEIAKDILQDTFLKIWNNFSKYNPEKGRLFTWMLTIARNISIDMVRSNGYLQEMQCQDIDRSFINNDLQHAHCFNPELIGLKEIIKKLHPKQKVIIGLLYFGGYTQTEAAKELNMPLGSIKTCVRKAIYTLRTQFNNLAVQVN